MLRSSGDPHEAGSVAQGALPRLWYVTDGTRGTGGRPLEGVIAAAARGGVGAVLLREFDRSGSEFESLLGVLAPLRARGLKLLASRRLDLALAYRLDGVQLTADAIPVARARAELGSHFWIGYSAHSIAEAAQAQAAGASYVTLSPVFASDSKPGTRPLGLDVLRAATRALDIPVLALGGVTPAQTRGILKAGAWGIAAVSALGAATDVESAARQFHRPLAEIPSCIARF